VTGGPVHGGRVLLELAAEAGDSVRYDVTLETRDGAWRSSAQVVVADGAVTMTAPEGAPPWLIDAARAFLRTVWNGRRGPDAAAWPRRVLRWRSAPRMAS
jgi:hypothetical protein